MNNINWVFMALLVYTVREVRVVDIMHLRADRTSKSCVCTTAFKQTNARIKT
ncbi:hypothetical protein [Limnofasciculus baicalensis]|uniref:Uncharacterized protein n=1 Tax=Limnofasciculus baicalensis BBK-W-15 TaxID=2699891 RepID=A0AAE3GUK4_9CYAN|nr:hypothetical protein [Limnofasciculus baicalensis]MCP2730251.1 hypothetical protein [Limnofasciculus baicalensis BBK-W-15]